VIQIFYNEQNLIQPSIELFDEYKLKNEIFGYEHPHCRHGRHTRRPHPNPLNYLIISGEITRLAFRPYNWQKKGDR